MLQVRLLPARQGDAIWVRWGHQALTHQLMVDMGTTETGRGLRQRLVGAGDFELLVVTHIDADHIAGVLSCLVEPEAPIAGCRFREIWFNGPKLEPADLAIETYGAAQGIALSAWLTTQAWNTRFGGAPVVVDGAPRSFALDGGLTVTVIGPPRNRLDRLGKVWTRELLDELGRRVAERFEPPIDNEPEGLESYGRKPNKPMLTRVAGRAADVTGDDDTLANGSSIALLLEHGDHAVLLAGDAFPGDLLAGIAALGRPRPLRLDAFKLPHHGSRRNVTSELIEAVDCARFLFSTDGTQFYHPDVEAVACVITHGRRGARPPWLGFNCRSRYSWWWASPGWSEKLGYTFAYGDDDDGLTIDLP